MARDGVGVLGGGGVWATGLDEVPGEEDDEEQAEDMEVTALGADASCTASSTLNTCFSCFLCRE